MNYIRRFNNFYGLFIALLYLYFGLRHISGSLHVYGRGVVLDNEITFGLVNWLDLIRTHYYDVDPFYFSMIVFLVLALINIIYFKRKRQSDFSKMLYFIALLLLSYPLLILYFNFEETTILNPNTPPFLTRLSSLFDGSSTIDYQIRIKVSKLDLSIIIYSFVLSAIMFLVYLLKPLFSSKKPDITEMDHLIDN